MNVKDSDLVPGMSDKAQVRSKIRGVCTLEAYRISSGHLRPSGGGESVLAKAMSSNPLNINQLQNFMTVDNIYLALTRIVGREFSLLVECSWLSGAFRFLPPLMVPRVSSLV